MCNAVNKETEPFQDAGKDERTNKFTSFSSVIGGNCINIVHKQSNIHIVLSVYFPY